MLSNEIKNFFEQNNNKVTLKKYINFCLYSKHGFYELENIFGKKGHFVTSPDISSIFGEILAIFLGSIAQKYFEGKKVFLVEIGGGGGTLMKDTLDAIAKFSNLSTIFQPICVDKSKKNLALQRDLLSSYGAIFYETVYEIDTKNEPVVVVANELLDAYPVEQYFFRHTWEKAFVTLQGNTLNLSYQAIDLLDDLRNINYYLSYLNKSTSCIEYSGEAIREFKHISSLIQKNTGLLLYIDYGYLNAPNSSTLQAVSNHKKVNIFHHPGKSDITHLVNFELFYNIARKIIKDAPFLRVITQREFLLTNGIEIRLKRAINRLSDTNQARILSQAVERLVDEKGMGNLFKVLICGRW